MSTSSASLTSIWKQTGGEGSPWAQAVLAPKKICGNDSVAKVVMPLIRFPRYPYFDRNPLGRIKVINSLVFLMKRVGIINANDYHYVDFS